MSRTSRASTAGVVLLAVLTMAACGSEEWGEKYGAPPETPALTVTPSSTPSPSTSPLSPAAVQREVEVAKVEHLELLASVQADFATWLASKPANNRRDMTIQYFCDSDRGSDKMELLYVEFGATRKFGVSADGQHVNTWLDGLDPIAFGAALQTCTSTSER